MEENSAKAVQVLLEQAKFGVRRMNHQCIANLMWSLKELRYYDKELLLTIEDLIINPKKNLKFTSQEVSNIILSFANFGLENKEGVLYVLVDQFLRNDKWFYQEYANLIYALAILQCPVELTQRVVNIIDQDFENFTQDKSELKQLRRAQLIYACQNIHLVLPQDLQLSSQMLIRKENQQRSNSSLRFIKRVFDFVKSRYQYCQKQVKECEIIVDIVIYQGNAKVALMVYTQDCFSINEPFFLLGRFSVYQSLLQWLGWKVVQVSLKNWWDGEYRQQILNEIKWNLR
eukprot:TRINITY_DN5161_c0_g1_i6.p2 TRINITY_DN5161_c0_g1~~TRINITY_DN5161_c0_g1_i6.p2  ORF type:complete len:287 (+),score=16.75 TRINITY_DN5161_c0_g1_i6:1249-2109(+)